MEFKQLGVVGLGNLVCTNCSPGNSATRPGAGQTQTVMKEWVGVNLFEEDT